MAALALDDGGYYIQFTRFYRDVSGRGGHVFVGFLT
jgi:hypothetical protein